MQRIGIFQEWVQNGTLRWRTTWSQLLLHYFYLHLRHGHKWDIITFILGYRSESREDSASVGQK